MRSIGNKTIMAGLLLSVATLPAVSVPQDAFFDSTSFVLAESNKLAAERRAKHPETCAETEKHLKERLVDLTERFTQNMHRIDDISSKIHDVASVEKVREQLVAVEQELAVIQAQRIETARKIVLLRQQSKTALKGVRADFDIAVMQQVEAALATAEAALSAAK